MRPTPCIAVCIIEQDTGLCRGCYRTANEIARWLIMSEDEQDALLAELKIRSADRPKPQRRGGRARVLARARNGNPTADDG